MKLVYENSAKEVQVGDIVQIRGTDYIVRDIVRPHKPSSTGRVGLVSLSEKLYYFPNVIGAHWIEREDRNEI